MLTASDNLNDTSVRSEVRRMWGLAWPVSLGMIGLMGMSVVDTLLVGRLGALPMASVALGVSWFFGINVVGMGALRALDPVIAQAFGARDTEAVGHGAVRGVVMACMLSIPMMALQLLAGPGLRALGQPEELLSIASKWCMIAALGIPGMLAFSALRHTLQAVGTLRPATIAILLANIVNLACAWSAIHLLGLGPLGTAAASVVSQYLLAGLTLWLGWSTFRPLFIGWRRALAWTPLRALLLIGLPLGVQMAMEAWAFHLSGLMMGWLGPTAIAGNAVVFNLATISFMVPLGVGAAAATRIGHLVGAGKPWGRSATIAVLLGAGLMSGSALLFSFAPGFLGGLYTHDPAVLAIVVALLPIAGAFQLFDGIQVVAFGALRGAGDVRLPSLANLLGYWALGLPLGWWLAFRAGWGPAGILTGLALGLAAVAVLLLVRLRWIAGSQHGASARRHG